MLSRFVLALLLLTTTPAGVAQAALGFGGYYCHRGTDDHPTNDWTSQSKAGLAQYQWVLGYLQGAAGSAPPKVRDAYVVAWVSAYCIRYPQNKIEQAAEALLREVRTQKAQP